MTGPASIHDDAGRLLGAIGQRYTHNRRVLVEILVAAGRPLAIPDILEARRELPQSSVYRNLGVLETAGIARRVIGADDFSRYELAEDLTDHHHHLVCTGCGEVADIRLSPRLERTMERAIDEVATDTGFRPLGHRLDLVGLCSACG